MYKWLIILLVFFSCENKQYADLSVDDFIGTYKSSDDNVLDTLVILKNETFRHIQYSEINNSFILLDSGSWLRLDKRYRLENYRFNQKDEDSSLIIFEPYLGSFGTICIDLDLNGQYKYVKIKN